MEIGSCS